MERTNKGLVVAVVILTILVLGLGGYIVYDKFMINEKDTSKENETTQNEATQDEELTNINYTEINNQLNKYFGGVAYVPILDVNDLSTDARSRILFTTLVIEKDEESKETDDDAQTLNYVTKAFFKEKYQSIYGTKYSFEEDYKNLGDTAVLFEDSKRLENDTYGWNNTRGIAPIAGTLEATNLVKENDKYILSGKFIFTDRSGEKTETKEGTFKIIYTKENDNRYLEDVILD